MNVTSISVLNFHWKDWCWSWNTNTLAIWCEKLSHWKWHWCWERIKTRGKEDDRGWDGWMASSTQRTWVWASSGHWEWTGKPGLLQCKESQAVGQNWMTELTGGKKKIKLIADLLLFSKTGNTFFFTKKLWNVLKMKGVRLEMFHENVFQNWKPKIFSDKQMLIHHQQTSNKMNLEGNISGRRKIRPKEI